MLFILDTADLETIRYCNEYYPIAGVTTNPAIIALEKSDFWSLIKEIRSVIGEEKMLFVQTVQSKADKMVEEAKLLRRELGENFYVKIPANEEGIKATAELKKLGIKVTVTAIFTPMQALMAARAGASYVAPYVNKTDNVFGDGTEVVAEIVKLFELHDLDCKVLAASFRNTAQIYRCAASGCHSVTLTAESLKTLLSNPMTELVVEDFDNKWEGAYGDKKILDFEV